MFRRCWEKKFLLKIWSSSRSEKGKIKKILQMNSFRWRDPIHARAAALLVQSIKEHESIADSNSSVELEVRLGSASVYRSRGRIAVPFPTRHPTIFGDEMKSIGTFEPGVAFQRLEKVESRMSDAFKRRLPSRSERSVVVSVLGEGDRTRLEYAATSPPGATVVHATLARVCGKVRRSEFDLFLPDSAADARFGLSVERAFEPPPPRKGSSAVGSTTTRPLLGAGEPVASYPGNPIRAIDDWTQVAAKHVRLRQRRSLALTIPRLHPYLPLFTFQATVGGVVGHFRDWSGFKWSEAISFDMSRLPLRRSLHLEVEVDVVNVRAMARQAGEPIEAAADEVAGELLSLVRLLTDP
jgi:hypothetical protein